MKPKVITKCPANVHASPNERIIEFTFPGTKAKGGYRQGGLISFRVVDGKGRVDVYNYDDEVKVNK